MAQKSVVQGAALSLRQTSKWRYGSLPGILHNPLQFRVPCTGGDTTQENISFEIEAQTLKIWKKV